MSDIYLPGELVNKSEIDRIAGVVFYKDAEGHERFRRLSMKRDKSIIPLRGPYIPRIGDHVIGVISDVKFSFYIVDMNIAFAGILPTKMTRIDYRVGQIIVASVFEINESGEITLNMPRTLRNGAIVKIDSTKIPRILGKEETMINMLRNKLDCEIAVGKNGYIWVSGKNTPQAINLLKMIESQSHTKGLTNRIESYLSKLPGLQQQQKNQVQEANGNTYYGDE